MSVLQSGWEKKYKLHFLGEDFCDIRETNVPNIRLMYRKETLDAEISDLHIHSS
jgi:AMP deaminase